jgi:hypothetical protein
MQQISAENYDIVVPANSSLRIPCVGSYFKLLSTAGAVNLRSQNLRLNKMKSGQGVKETPFTELVFTDVSGGDNAISFLVSDREFVDATNGNANILSNKVAQSAAYANASATVTTTSTVVLAANANRQYLLIQNNDLSGQIYVTFGAAATPTTGIKIGPGGNYESGVVCSTQSVNIIGSVASNANVVTVQG